MKYTKHALSFEEQAELLLSRGLIADRTDLISKLKSVNYYRLSGYLYPFKQPNSENYKDGTKFTEVWNRYRFDRKLRFLVLDGIERIEVALKTDIVFEFSRINGPFGHLNKKSLMFLLKALNMKQNVQRIYL